MARGQGAAARAAKARKANGLKAKVKSLAPVVDQDAVAKRPVGRPRKNKHDPDEEVNELCIKGADGYAEGTHTHISLSHAVH